MILRKTADHKPLLQIRNYRRVFLFVSAFICLLLGAVGAQSTCVQDLAIGNFRLCGESYNDVSAGTNVKVNYSPSAGNGIIAHATWCFTRDCASSLSGVTATIGDDINATESCLVASPHSPFVTDGKGAWRVATIFSSIGSGTVQAYHRG